MDSHTFLFSLSLSHMEKPPLLFFFFTFTYRQPSPLFFFIISPNLTLNVSLLFLSSLYPIEVTTTRLKPPQNPVTNGSNGG